MMIQKLSDSVLLSQTKSLVREETRTTTEILHHLLEIEARKLFCALGFSSLFEYAVKELSYSESAAQLRIDSMRLLRELPQVEAQVQSGELTLSVLVQAQKFFRQEAKMGRPVSATQKQKVVQSLEGKSAREAERTLLAMSPQPEKHRSETVRPVSADFSEVRLNLSTETLEDLEKLKGLLAHQFPEMTLSDLVAHLAKRALKELDPAQKEVRAKASVGTSTVQSIPAAVKRAVWRRDSSRCTYVDPETGRRCESRHRLQIDHRHPKGLGGGNDVENLRLLCAQHNAFEAARIYGREAIQPFWHN
ncbi:MAG: HNH endonuclease signature motif containing protein [Oligoflexia bacterium]|nr:HNH endonuclease signature motif containing protein [Oligoflexia bacterium]